MTENTSTTTEATPGRAPVTPGQAAFREHFARFHSTYAPDVARRHAAQSWEYVSDAKRQDWDAVAQAAIRVAAPALVSDSLDGTELGHVYDQLAEARAELAELDAAYKTLDAQCEVHWLERQSAESRLEVVTAERDKLAEGGRALDRVVNSQARAMYAALIDAIHGDPNDASSILTEQFDGFDGEQWNGTETGTEWLERTRETDESTPEAQS